MKDNEKFPLPTAAEQRAARQKLQDTKPEQVDRGALEASKAVKQDQLNNNKIVTKHGTDNI